MPTIQESCGYVDWSPTTAEPEPCPNRLPCPKHGDPSGRLFRFALTQAAALLEQADQARYTAERYGGDSTYGDTGIPVTQLAGQFAAEAQAWASLAQALATDLHTRVTVGY